MNTRLVALYLRSRGVPQAVLGFTALLVTVALAGEDVAPLDPIMQAQVLVLATMLTAVFVVGGLGSPSPQLDATAPVRWWRWRATHILTGLLSSAAALATVAASTGGAALALISIRNVLGFGGLTALTAVVAGTGLSWTLPLTYALIVQLPLPASTWERVMRWPLLAGGTELSWWPALGLFTAGVALLCTCGAASHPDR